MTKYKVGQVLKGKDCELEILGKPFAGFYEVKITRWKEQSQPAFYNFIHENKLK